MFMALFHRHGEVDAVLTAIAWRRATIIEHSRWELTVSPNEPSGWRQTRNIRLIRDDFRGDQWEYEHLVWGEGRVVASGGDSQEGLNWAEFSLWPNERVGKKTESYTGTFEVVDDSATDADKVHQATFDEQPWRELKVGHTYRLEFGVLGRVRKVNQVT